MHNNNSTLQAPGGYPNHQDSRRRKDGNEVRHPQAIILSINAGIRAHSIGPQLTTQGAPVSTMYPSTTRAPAADPASCTPNKLIPSSRTWLLINAGRPARNLLRQPLSPSVRTLKEPSKTHAMTSVLQLALLTTSRASVSVATLFRRLQDSTEDRASLKTNDPSQGGG